MTTNNDAQNTFYLLDNEAYGLWRHIEDGTTPNENDSEYSHLFEYGSFDSVGWINENCLEANTHELLLATGGPAYGVVLIQNFPYFWYQDWFESKTVVPAQSGSAFYRYIFETLKELVT